MEAITSVIKAFNEINDKDIDTTNTKINLATLLTCFDGIGNKNGSITVAITNHIDKLDTALYRDLRLTPIEFKKLRKCDCIEIIHMYFGSNYNQSFNNIIKERKITPTKLICLCQTYENLTAEEFIMNKLSSFFET